MFSYIKENSRIITKLILNQFGAAVLGLALSGVGVSRDSIFIFTSLFSIAFYLFILYSAMWEEGGKERIRVDGGRADMKPLRGLWVAIIANIPNLLLALFILLFTLFGYENGPFAWEWAGGLAGTLKVFANFWEAMYLGLVRVYSPYNPIAYLLIAFPGIAICAIAYYLGINNKRLLGFMAKKR